MENKIKSKGALNIISIIVTLTILALAIYGIISSKAINEQTAHLIEGYGVSALFIISFFLDIIPQIVSPILALGTGLILGMNIYYAVLATILGSTAGSILGFCIGKKYLFDAVDFLSSEKSTKKFTYLINKYGKVIIPIAAISPLPYLPVVLGAIDLSKKNFIIFGLIPRALGIIGYGILFSFF